MNEIISIVGIEQKALVSSLGGQVISFIDRGTEIIYLQRLIEEKVRGGIPICFPCFSTPKGRFAGKISQHGWLRNQILELAGRSNCMVDFQGENKNIESYPWRLEYHVSSAINLNGALQLELCVQRYRDGIGQGAPVNPGFHPYFVNLGKTAVRIGKKEITNFNDKAQRIPLEGQKNLIIDLGQKKVEMSLGGDFGEKSCVALWSDKPTAYFCVEPIFYNPDDFDTPRGKYLEQGDYLRLTCSLKVIN
jgi:D-hexose-6-phosphate mutarotase